LTGAPPPTQSRQRRALLLRPTVILPGEDWSLPGKRPRNSYMKNLGGQCQGGPEGENYRKLPGPVKRPKTKKKSGGVL